MFLYGSEVLASLRGARRRHDMGPPFVWVMTPVVGVPDCILLASSGQDTSSALLALLDHTERQLVVPAMCVVCHVPVAEDAGRYRTHPGAIKAAFIVLWMILIWPTWGGDVWPGDGTYGRLAGWLSVSLGGHGSTYEVSSLLLLLLAVPETFVPTRICQFQVVLQKSLLWFEN